MSDLCDTECRLFYRADPAAVFARLTRTLIDAFAATGIDLRPRLASATELAFASGGMTLSVERKPCTLDMAAFVGVNRPEAATARLGDTLKQLAAHTCAITIKIEAPAHAARKETRLAICYIAVMEMLKLAQPDCVHWGNSNTLYTIEEFCSSTGAHTPIEPQHTAIPDRTAKTDRPARTALKKPRVFGRAVVPMGRLPQPRGTGRARLFAASRNASLTASA